MLCGDTTQMENGRKEMTSCFSIGMCAVGDFYVSMAVRVLQDVRMLNDFKAYVMTDKKEAFSSIKNIHIIGYSKPIFSYHDKLIVCKKALSENDSVLLIDADHRFSKNTKMQVSCDSFECGCYPEWCFDNNSDWSMTGFLDGKNREIPYGNEFEKFCSDRGYRSRGLKHIQESCMLIKETDDIKKQKFFKAWGDLKDFCNKIDLDRRNKEVLGAGEGYSIAVALDYAGIAIRDNKAYRNLLLGFKHLRYEKNNKGKV